MTDQERESVLRVLGEMQYAMVLPGTQVDIQREYDRRILGMPEKVTGQLISVTVRTGTAAKVPR